ncbi:MAG: hypothetical protein Q7S38_01920 [bacterium]|nr:hypothetical protein [bacterium]
MDENTSENLSGNKTDEQLQASEDGLTGNIFDFLKADENFKTWISKESEASQATLMRLGEEKYGQNLKGRITRLSDLFVEVVAEIRGADPNLVDDPETIPLQKENMRDSIKKKTEEIFINYQDELVSSNDQLVPYVHNISGFDPKIAEEIAVRLFGWNINTVYENEIFSDILSRVKTFNELSNLMHSYVLESCWVLQSGDYNKRVILVGEETSTVKTVDRIMNEISATTAVIVSPPDSKEIFVQVRDMGHATSFRIEEKEKGYFVNYWATIHPTNQDIKNLPGFEKYVEIGGHMKTIVGSFFVGKKEFSPTFSKLATTLKGIF